MINTHIKLQRRPKILLQTGWSKSSLYNRIKDGLFPPQISIGDRAVAFIEHEVNAVIQAMIEEKTPKQIKALVADLIKQRKQAA